MPTVKQAELLWCPMVRQGGDDATASYNRGYRNNNPVCISKTTPVVDGAGGCHCIGDQCMMWRWEAPPLRKGKDFPQTSPPEIVTEDRPDLRLKYGIPASWEFHPQEDEAACWAEPEAERVARHSGFCGLAGRLEVLK